jgi:hypothetical protein
MAQATTQSTVTLVLSGDEADALAQVLSCVGSDGASPSYVAAMNVFDALVEQAGARYKSLSHPDFPFSTRMRRLIFRDGS